MSAFRAFGKFLISIAPLIPDVLSAIATLKDQHAEPHAREDPFQARIAKMERGLTEQRERIENVTKQVDALQTLLRRTLLIGIVALGLALTALALIFSA